MTRRPPQPDLSKALIPALDDCAICLERDEALHHGTAFCAGNFRRQHPTCTHDGRRPRFNPDIDQIEAIRSASDA